MPDCTQCLVKVLATDGFNTGSDTSDATFEMDNNLNITFFNIVYQNNTERIFKIDIENTLNETLNNVTWTLDTGDGVISSEADITLQGDEEASVFVYHNYSSIGSYNASVVFRSNIFIEIGELEVMV